MLGWCHLNGFGTVEDEEKGFRKIKSAARGNRGNVEAKFRLATCYVEGSEPSKTSIKAWTFSGTR